jgi:hypothetical protein
MKCFNVVQQVLDATYAEIPGNEATRAPQSRTMVESRCPQDPFRDL